MNKIILVGRLARDPDVKNTTTGKAVATFTLAVDRRFKNKDGQKETDFIPIVVWGQQAEFVGKYIGKGKQVSLSGRLQVRTYEAQDGQKRWITEVVADEVNGIGGKPKESSDSSMPEQLGGGMDEDFHLMADDDDVPF